MARGVARRPAGRDDGRGRAASREVPIESEQLAELVVRAALEKKASDPAILGVGDLVGYADWFVVVSGRSPRQVAAIAEGVRAALKQSHGLLPVGVEGLETSKWVLVDYGDVVLHVFQENARTFYDLEGLWADAPRRPVPAEVRVPDDEPLFSFPS